MHDTFHNIGPNNNAPSGAGVNPAATATTNAATTPTDPALAAGGECPEVTDKEKKDAILKKYCDIIDEQKDKIITKFNESFEKFLESVFQKNGAELSKFIEDIIFIQMKKSILDNYYVQNSFVADILQIEKIKNMLQGVYNDTNGKNGIIDNFVTELENYLKDQESVGVDNIDLVIIGGDPPDDINKLMEWFPTKEDNTTNEEMVSIVKKNIERCLNDDQVKNNVIKNIIPKLDSYISTSSADFMNDLSERLKIRILYALLTSETDRRVHTKFKGALDKAEINDGGFNNFESFMNTIIAHFGGTPSNKKGGKSQSRKQKKTKKGKSRKNKRTNKKTNKKTRH